MTIGKMTALHEEETSAVGSTIFAEIIIAVAFVPRFFRWK
jgi:hypothetical protein